MQIQLKDIYKSYKTKKGWNHVLRGVNLDIPHNKSVGILGRNGAGKSTLLSILSNIEVPDKGVIDRGGLKISWPIGKGGMQGSLTGIDNIKFICRVNGTNIDEAVAYIKDFSELGDYLNMPVKTYSSGMKSRLAFAMSMAVKFDTYLVDEGFNAGDARFTAKMEKSFSGLRERANMICVSHNPSIINKFCDMAAVLDKGQIKVYDSVDEAIEVYKKL